MSVCGEFLYLFYRERNERRPEENETKPHLVDAPPSACVSSFGIKYGGGRTGGNLIYASCFLASPLPPPGTVVELDRESAKVMLLTARCASANQSTKLDAQQTFKTSSITLRGF